MAKDKNKTTDESKWSYKEEKREEKEDSKGNKKTKATYGLYFDGEKVNERNLYIDDEREGMQEDIEDYLNLIIDTLLHA